MRIKRGLCALTVGIGIEELGFLGLKLRGLKVFLEGLGGSSVLEVTLLITRPTHRLILELQQQSEVVSLVLFHGVDRLANANALDDVDLLEAGLDLGGKARHVGDGGLGLDDECVDNGHCDEDESGKCMCRSGGRLGGEYSALFHSPYIGRRWLAVPRLRGLPHEEGTH